MSNDREAFEEAFRLRNVSYPLTRSKTGLRDYKEERTEGAWQGWQAAQSRHAAERKALVRKCAEIVAEHETDWDFAYDDILALLSDSGSQG